MAVLTYRTDIAPHLRRSLVYRRLRLQRWQALHAPFCRSGNEYDPYGWAESAQFLDVLAGLAVLVWLMIADSAQFNLLRSPTRPAAIQ